ncbi:MAG: hypothetical protein RL219_1097 [Actinomycetota bacterium]
MLPYDHGVGSVAEDREQPSQQPLLPHEPVVDTADVGLEQPQPQARAQWSLGVPCAPHDRRFCKRCRPADAPRWALDEIEEPARPVPISAWNAGAPCKQHDIRHCRACLLSSDRAKAVDKPESPGSVPIAPTGDGASNGNREYGSGVWGLPPCARFRARAVLDAVVQAQSSSLPT